MARCCARRRCSCRRAASRWRRGAAIDTIGAGRAYYDSAEGYLYSPGRSAVLALSNGLITMLAPDAPQGPEQSAGSDRDRRLRRPVRPARPALHRGHAGRGHRRPLHPGRAGPLRRASAGAVGERRQCGQRAGAGRRLRARAAGRHDLEPGAAGSAAHGRRGFRRAGAGSTDADGQGLGQLLRNGGPERLGVACGQALGPAN